MPNPNLSPEALAKLDEMIALARTRLATAEGQIISTLTARFGSPNERLDRLGYINTDILGLRNLLATLQTLRVGDTGVR